MQKERNNRWNSLKMFTDWNYNNKNNNKTLNRHVMLQGALKTGL